MQQGLIVGRLGEPHYRRSDGSADPSDENCDNSRKVRDLIAGTRGFDIAHKRNEITLSEYVTAHRRALSIELVRLVRAGCEVSIPGRPWRRHPLMHVPFIALLTVITALAAFAAFALYSSWVAFGPDQRLAAIAKALVTALLLAMAASRVWLYRLSVRADEVCITITEHRFKQKVHRISIQDSHAVRLFRDSILIELRGGVAVRLGGDLDPGEREVAALLLQSLTEDGRPHRR